MTTLQHVSAAQEAALQIGWLMVATECDDLDELVRSDPEIFERAASQWREAQD
jgi:hypothetical protein